MIITETFERTHSIPKQAFLCRAVQVLCGRWLGGCSRSRPERSHLTPQICFGTFSTSSVVQDMSTRGERGAGSALTACPTLPFTFVSFYCCLTGTLLNFPPAISCAQGQGCLSQGVLWCLLPRCTLLRWSLSSLPVPGLWGWLAPGAWQCPCAAPDGLQLSLLQELPALLHLQAEPWL